MGWLGLFFYGDLILSDMESLGRCNNNIFTVTGKCLDLFNPDPSLICNEDIAHGLSFQCRYNGQVNRFLSVAGHSVNVAAHAYFVFGVRDTPRLRAFLYHDAAEAYLGDIVRPIKVLLPQYRQLESLWDSAICRAFDIEIDSDLSQMVKLADVAVCMREAMELVNTDSSKWDWGSVEISPVHPVDEYKDFALSRAMFLQAANAFMEDKSHCEIFPCPVKVRHVQEVACG